MSVSTSKKHLSKVKELHLTSASVIFSFILTSATSSISVSRSGLPLYVSVNQHAEILRIVYILTFIDIQTFGLLFDIQRPLDMVFHLVFKASLKLAVGGIGGYIYGLLVSQWTKKIVRDNHNMIQLILGSYLVLLATFKLFADYGSRFTAIVAFTLCIKTQGFSKHKFDSSSL